LYSRIDQIALAATSIHVSPAASFETGVGAGCRSRQASGRGRSVTAVAWRAVATEAVAGGASLW